MDRFELDRARAAIETFGTAEQQARFAGRRVVMAVSEPDAGSDVAAITTRAVRDGDDFVIDGQKKYIAGIADADYLAVVVRTGRDGPAHRQLSTILVPVRAPGVEVQPILDMLGRHRSDKVFLTGVRVPVANVLGEEGKGWHQHALVAGSAAAGKLEHRVEEALARALVDAKRGPVSPAARLAVAEDAIRANVAAGIRGSGTDQGAASSQLLAAEALQGHAARAVSLAGTSALLRECNGAGGAASTVVDAAYATVEFGTAELLRNEIARSLGLE